jgi:hypothetical protein
VRAAGEDRSPLVAVAVGAGAGLVLVAAWLLVSAGRRKLVRRRGHGPDEPRQLAAAPLPPRPAPARASAPELGAPPRPPEFVPAAALPAPPAEREHCEIVWWTNGEAAQFRAIGRNRSGRRYVAGRSPTVADPRPPLRQAETLEAWETLVRHLETRGWTPQGPHDPLSGAPWYAHRFERARRPARKPAQPAGGRR